MCILRNTNPYLAIMITQSPYEIERAFVVETPPSNYNQFPHSDIAQGYYRDAVSGILTRLRRKDSQFYQTIKKGVGLVREEIETELTGEQFDTLWPLTKGWRIEKIRYKIPLGQYLVELDVYKGPLQPYISAEVEFDSVEASQAFTPPSWLGREVTEDVRYTNAQLAKYGLPEDFG